LAIAIRLEGDIAAARNAVRETGLALGFPVPALRLAQAVISEMCLYALNSGIAADLSVYALKRAGREGISMVMQAPVEIAEKELNDDRLAPGLGLAGAKRLSDHWEVSVRRGKTTVHAIKWQPDSTHADLAGQYLQMVETAPHKAWEFGRQAVLDGLGITAMAVLHAEAMKLVSDPAQAQLCFEEVLAAFEMVYLGCSEARACMSGIHELLEQETERIAQSLHDEAAQAMAALSIGVNDLQCEKASSCGPHVVRLRAMVEEADNLFRGLSHELRPPLLENEGLAPALQHLSENFSSRRGIRVEFRDDLQRRLAPPLERAMYRTVQTALANVVRHARASNVVVRIFASGASVVCSVRDDGRGIDSEQPRSPGLGLRGVRERAAALGGTLELESVLPHGLEIRIRLPDQAADRLTLPTV
jgi:signal transduction histidine kinase